VELVGFLVNDYRDLETWKEGRFLVCVLLELTESFSQAAHHGRLAENINRLSLSILVDIANGYEHAGKGGYQENARRSIDLLERELATARGKGLLKVPDSDHVLQILKTVRRSLKSPCA